MDLYLDLSKARTLNRAKLVKRAVQVRGKNGKIYTRMQWVDPNTGEPVSDKHAHVENEPPKGMTQKEHIDAHVKKMTREQKYDHLQKHGVTWKPNDHEAIDHKNAMMALKDHLYKNPHLVGAEHLPKDDAGNKTKDGLDKINDFAGKYKKHPELLYKMLHHLGVTDSHEDPRTDPAQAHPSKGGNGKGDIMHMKNMMAFKKHLKDNPHHVDEMMNHPEFGKPHGTGQSAKVTDPVVAPTTPKPAKTQSKAQQGGNTIKGILDSMSREDKYKFCKHLGIVDGDPLLDPTIGSKMAPIHHMKFMMALKKAIEKDPSLLNLNTETGDISDEEKERLKGLQGEDKLKNDVDEFLKRASKNLKLEWAKHFEDHDHMKSRTTNDHENIDNMHKMNALKKIITDDPSLMNEEDILGADLQREELTNLKIGNKMMGKILREVVGLKGIGDVSAGFEKGREWEFGDESTAMIQLDDEDEPILSVYHVDKDGNEHDFAFPMKEVKEFLDGLKSGDAVEVKPKEVPLHRKTPKQMWEALHDDFDANYTKEVGDALKIEVSRMWEASGKSGLVSSMSAASPVGVTRDVLNQLLDKYHIPVDRSFVAKADTKSDAFKRVAYGHKVEKSKSKDAMSYLEKDQGGKNDTWVLHESAKHWSPDERTEARKDFIKGNFGRVDNEHKYPDAEDRKVMLVNHLHKSLEMVPLDLMTDVFAGGCSLHFSSVDEQGNRHRGNYHSSSTLGIKFDHAYFDDLDSLQEEHPMYHRPKPTPFYDDKDIDTGKKAGYHQFSDTVAHEFAHAIDSYLSGNNGNYVSWDKTEIGKKYTGKYHNVVKDSYDKAVEKSNPKKTIGRRGGAQKYVYHHDEWMSHYEGRIYDAKYYNDPTNHITKDSTGNPVDSSWNSRGERGLEHWSENVSRVINAYHAFKDWKDLEGETSISMEEWAGRMHDEYTAEGYGDEHNSDDGKIQGKKYITSYRRGGMVDEDKPINQMPYETYGYLYHTMSKRHPELLKGIHHIIMRPDFVGDKSVADPISRAEKNDYVRKSDVELIIDL